MARERGAAVTEVVADPYADDPALLAANPIVQVPTLIAMDGLVRKFVNSAATKKP